MNKWDCMLYTRLSAASRPVMFAQIEISRRSSFRLPFRSHLAARYRATLNWTVGCNWKWNVGDTGPLLIHCECRDRLVEDIHVQNQINKTLRLIDQIEIVNCSSSSSIFLTVWRTNINRNAIIIIIALALNCLISYYWLTFLDKFINCLPWNPRY